MLHSSARLARAFLPLLAAGFLVLACALPGAAPAATVYEGQADFTEQELMRFLADLPRFRSWHRSSGQSVHPKVTDGAPDFEYTPEAADWARSHGWEPVRFFCVMGRAAAAMAGAVEEKPIKAADMPSVSPAEIEAVNRHMVELLRVGGDGYVAAPRVPAQASEAQTPAPARMVSARPVPSKPVEIIDQSPRNRSGRQGGQLAPAK